MPVPIICLDEGVRHFAERYREHLSKPQYQHFVTVLLGLMQCEGRRVLSELLRQVSEAPSLAGLSRFLSRAPWDEQQIAEQWLRQFRAHLQPQVSAEVARQLQAQPKRRGRPKVRTPGDRASDWRRLDHAQAQGQEDGGTGQASLDDP